jgi:hypothetical protein
MDRLSIIMVRGALVWLMLGIVIGGLMLVDRAIPGDWRLWMTPSHGHILFVGWFLQFALGIAYWLLPRKRSSELPLGYRERVGLAGAVALNAGLACRVLGEPFERTGHASNLTLALLAVASILQVVAVGLFIAQLWPRIYGRGKMGKPAPGSGRASDA